MKIQLHPEAEKALRDMRILTVTKKEIARNNSYLRNTIPKERAKESLKNIVLEKRAHKVIIGYIDWEKTEKGINFWYDKYLEAEKKEKQITNN
jgi:hypothetical protein